MKFSIPAEQAVTGEIVDDPEQAASFDNDVRTLADHFGLAEDVAEAFTASSVPLHYVGLPREDARYADDAMRGRQRSLSAFIYSWQQIYEHGNFFPHINFKMPRVKGVHGIGKMMLASMCVWRDADSQALIPHLEETRDWGLSRSNLLYTTLSRLQFNYAHESPSVWDEDDLTITEIPPDDLVELFDGGVVPPGLDFLKLADYVRRNRDVDLSREMLEARLRNFIGQTQLEVANLVMEDLAQFAQTGGERPRRAAALAEQFKDDFLGDNILRKQQILIETATAFQESTARIKSSPLRRMIRLMSGRLRHTATDLDEFLQFFANTYMTMGYEVPAVLLEEVPAPPPAAEPVRAHSNITTKRAQRLARSQYEPAQVADAETPPVPAEVEPPRPELDPKVVGEIEQRLLDLRSQYAAFDSGWRVSAKTRKATGFDSMQRSLSEGFRSVLGRQLLAPVLKDRAQETIDILARLDKLAQKYTPDVVQENVATASLRRRDLYAAEYSLRQYAAAQGYTGRIELPALLNIEDHTNFIRREWAGFRQLIIDTWPKYDGPKVVARLEQIILPAAE